MVPETCQARTSPVKTGAVMIQACNHRMIPRSITLTFPDGIPLVGNLTDTVVRNTLGSIVRYDLEIICIEIADAPTTDTGAIPRGSPVNETHDNFRKNEPLIMPVFQEKLTAREHR
jgi:hypothetical protein